MWYAGFKAQLITSIHFRNEIHELIRFNHVMNIGSVPQRSYNYFSSQLQWMQYRI
jgi:hypothetical protein